MSAAEAVPSSHHSASGASSQALPAPTMFDKETIQSLPRHYIITQLTENGYEDIADRLQQVSNPNDPVHEIFQGVAANLNEEREQQFKEMLRTLALNNSNLKEVYDSIIAEMFKNSTHWGRIVAFTVFTSHFTLYCAGDVSLQHRVPEVVEWCDRVIQDKLHSWIEEQGGWQAFVDHFDLENWRVTLSSALLGLGVGVSAVVSGLIVLKKLFSS